MDYKLYDMNYLTAKTCLPDRQDTKAAQSTQSYNTLIFNSL